MTIFLVHLQGTKMTLQKLRWRRKRKEGRQTMPEKGLFYLYFYFGLYFGLHAVSLSFTALSSIKELSLVFSTLLYLQLMLLILSLTVCPESGSESVTSMKPSKNWEECV